MTVEEYRMETQKVVGLLLPLPETLIIVLRKGDTSQALGNRGVRKEGPELG